MFSLRKLGIYFLLLVSVFVFFKNDEFTFFQEKINKQETILLKTSEKKLDSKFIIEKNSEFSSLDTTVLEKSDFPLYNDHAQNIEVLPEELIALEALAKQNKGQGKVEINASDVTPQELLDMEYSVAQEIKEKGSLVEIESSDVTPQELLDMEYSVAQEIKEKGGLVEIESSDVTPQELLDLEYSVAQEIKEESGLVEVESSDVTPQELLDMEYSAAYDEGGR